MKKIRKGTFETNSSSMHSIVVEGMEETKEFNPKVDKNGYYHIKVDDYSNLTRDLETTEEIISFVASWIAENGYYENSFENDIMTQEDMKKFKGFDMLENILKKHSDIKGIIFEIDLFPSAESLNFDENEMLNPETVEKLIFGKKSYIEKEYY